MADRPIESSGEGHPVVRRWELTRREALEVLGGFGLIATSSANARAKIPAAGTAARARELLKAGTALLTASDAPDFSAQVTRAVDMLALQFDFYNMNLDSTSSPATVSIVDSTQSAYMVVVFPPQHVGEQALTYEGSAWPPADPPFAGILTAQTWLAFEVPGSIDFTLESLLTWTHLAPQLVPVAIPTAGASPAEPSALQTYMEVPWNLVLSPDAKGTWHHSATPVTHNGVTELWQTRLGKGKHEPPIVRPDIRAVWTPGYPEPASSDPFQMSLDPTTRGEIVTLTSGGTGVTGSPIAADLVMLSPLGAAITLDAQWSPPPASGIDLIGWFHRTSTGRDSNVRTVQTGFLFPTGHRAVLVTVTDREFWVDPNGDVVANLVQRCYVQVTQRSLTYTGNSNEPNAGRQNPLRKISITTTTTPPLDQNAAVSANFSWPDQASLVTSGGSQVLFGHVATDIEGREVSFSAPAIWVADSALLGPDAVSGAIQLLTTAYGDLSPLDSPTFGGQLLALSEPQSGEAGQTAQVVETYTMSAIASSDTSVLPGYFPMMGSAGIRLPAVEQLAGASGGAESGAPPTAKFDGTYLSDGFQTGQPAIYADIEGGPSLAFPGQNTGGLIVPNFSVTSLARDSGPTGGTPTDLLSGSFVPSSVFPTGNGALLLGAIEISDILQQVPDGSDSSLTVEDQLPQLVSTFTYTDNDESKPPTAVTTTLDWQPGLAQDSNGVFTPGTLRLHAQIYTPYSDPSAATYSIDSSLSNFTLNLFGSTADLIEIDFSSLRFRAGTGSKAVVEPNITGVSFMGDLAFVNELASLLSSLGGPSIDLSSSGVTASYDLPLPDFAVGVFSIQNLSIASSLTIPFTSAPARFRFGLCTRENPFILTIDFFGGGGFFSVAVGADGIEALEISLEFGAAISLDFGVASGSASIMAGIYFELEPNDVQLTGFLRADGSLEVLGILSLTIELYLGLTYQNPGAAYGQAQLTVSVQILCFSASVTLTYQKTIGGSGSGVSSGVRAMLPDVSEQDTYSFGQAMSATDWANYCAGFAAA